MKTWKRRIVVVLLVMAMSLTGCATEWNHGIIVIHENTGGTTQEVSEWTNPAEETTFSQEDKTELWVMYGTDSRTGFPPPKFWEHMVEQFSEEYPDVKVRLERVPEDEAELQLLRTEIMEDMGPDVFLMCRNSTLIPDPYQAMRNGLFMDISEYYDEDAGMKKDELNETIMDAGIYGGCRYVIPYSYDFPVAYVDTAQFEALGGRMDMFDGGIMKLYEDLFATGNQKLIWGASIGTPSQRFHSFNYLPDMVDYENQAVLVTAEDIAQFLRAVQTARAEQPFDLEDLPYPSPNYLKTPKLDGIRMDKKSWRDYIGMYIGVMSEHVINVGFTKMSGIEIQAVPVAAADGDLVADVLFYGAVGAGCKEPELAYAFLQTVSTFLRNESAYSPNGMMSIGWPVRMVGSAENIANHSESVYAFGEFWFAFPGSEKPVITNDDIPFLYEKIDRVQFYTAPESELSDIIDTLNDPNTGEELPVDINAVAVDFIEELEWHLYEG